MNLTLLQWIGLVVGSLIVVARVPGVLWPEEYKTKVRAIVQGSPAALKALGVFLWVVALATFVLVAKTLTLLQALMMILAVFFVVGGVVILFFPAAYRGLAERVLGAMPQAGVRIACALGVLFGVWVVYLSLTMP